MLAPPPESTGGFAVDSFPMGPGLGQAVETVWRWYTRAPGMLGARSRQPGAERPQVHPSTTNIYFWADLCRYIYLYTHTMSSDIYPHPIVPTHQGPPRGPGSRPMPPRCPPPRTPARTRPPCPRGAPGDSPRPFAPTAQPACCVTPNTPSPTGQFPLPCCICPLPPSAGSARRRPRPAHHQGHPANWLTLPPLPALPPKGSPCWHHRATRGLPGVGYPPGARPSTTPARVGVVHNRPRDTPCRP